MCVAQTGTYPSSAVQHSIDINNLVLEYNEGQNNLLQAQRTLTCRNAKTDIIIFSLQICANWNSSTKPTVMMSHIAILRLIIIYLLKNKFTYDST